jgi:hypothetical protein
MWRAWTAWTARSLDLLHVPSPGKQDGGGTFLAPCLLASRDELEDQGRLLNKRDVTDASRSYSVTHTFSITEFEGSGVGPGETEDHEAMGEDGSWEGN